MVDWRYADGADYLPSEAIVRQRRAPDQTRRRRAAALARSQAARTATARSMDLLSSSSSSPACPTAATLFLVASGLSIIFGVTRIVNFAHGSFYMLGAYLAYTLTAAAGARRPLRLLGRRRAGRARRGADRRRWSRSCCCAASTAAPELFQLLATFGVVLIVQDLALRDLGAGGSARSARAGPARARSSILGQRFPQYDLFLIVLGPARARRAVAAVPPHPLGHAGARRHAGPRDGRRARRQPALAVHRGVRSSARASPGWAARCRCRARRSTCRWTCTIIVEAFVVVVVGGLGQRHRRLSGRGADRRAARLRHRAASRRSPWC